MARVILYTGGARSGKSGLALARAETIGVRKLFVATCPVIDGEMNQRIDRHRQERQGRGWQTIECPVEIARVFPEPAKDFEVVVIDCLTLWVNNILYAGENTNKIIDDASIAAATRQWLDASQRYDGTLICVTNEIGLGIVPDNPLARRYRDLVGTCNQVVAGIAQEVILVSCGLPLHLKNNE